MTEPLKTYEENANEAKEYIGSNKLELKGSAKALFDSFVEKHKKINELRSNPTAKDIYQSNKIAEEIMATNLALEKEQTKREFRRAHLKGPIPRPLVDFKDDRYSAIISRVSHLSDEDLFSARMAIREYNQELHPTIPQSLTKAAYDENKGGVQWGGVTLGLAGAIIGGVFMKNTGLFNGSWMAVTAAAAAVGAAALALAEPIKQSLGGSSEKKDWKEERKVDAKRKEIRREVDAGTFRAEPEPAKTSPGRVSPPMANPDLGSPPEEAPSAPARNGSFSSAPNKSIEDLAALLKDPLHGTLSTASQASHPSGLSPVAVAAERSRGIS